MAPNPALPGNTAILFNSTGSDAVNMTVTLPSAAGISCSIPSSFPYTEIHPSTRNPASLPAVSALNFPVTFTVPAPEGIGWKAVNGPFM